MKVAASKTLLASICQRIPIMLHLIFGTLVIAGPTYCPLLYTTTLFLLHSILCISNVQCLWGTYCAWKGVEYCSQCDWYEVWKHKSKDVSFNILSSFIKPSFDRIEHVILIPSYKDELNTLRETLDILASHTRAKANYRICLAMEKRETGAERKALCLVDEYRGAFLEIISSLHPVGLEGEIPGKSSNVNWASRFMAKRCADHAHQIITVIDSDTALAQDYFDCVTTCYCLAPAEDRARMMFAVPIVFDRNAHNVPISVKVTGKRNITFFSIICMYFHQIN